MLILLKISLSEKMGMMYSLYLMGQMRHSIQEAIHICFTEENGKMKSPALVYALFLGIVLDIFNYVVWNCLGNYIDKITRNSSVVFSNVLTFLIPPVVVASVVWLICRKIKNPVIYLSGCVIAFLLLIIFAVVFIIRFGRDSMEMVSFAVFISTYLSFPLLLEFIPSAVEFSRFRKGQRSVEE